MSGLGYWLARRSSNSRENNSEPREQQYGRHAGGRRIESEGQSLTFWELAAIQKRRQAGTTSNSTREPDSSNSACAPCANLAGFEFDSLFTKMQGRVFGKWRFLEDSRRNTHFSSDQ
jgi:hypothetical protein